MLDLEPRVHLEEIEVAVRPDDELHGAGASVAHGLRERHSLCAHCRARLLVQERRRRLLQDLLVAPLDGAFALAEMDDVSVRVGEHLDLDVTRLRNELLQEHAVVAEGGACLGARAFEAFAKLSLVARNAHPLAAAAGRGLDHHREADSLGDRQRPLGIRDDAEMAGHGGDPCPCRGLLGFDLVAHRFDRLRRRADEDDARRLERTRERSVLGKEAVARMHGLSAGLLSRADDLLDGKIARGRRRRPDRHRLVGHLDMRRVPVRLRVDSDRGNPHPPRRAHHAHRDLAPIGDEDFAEHAGRLLPPKL